MLKEFLFNLCPNILASDSEMLEYLSISKAALVKLGEGVHNCQ